MLSQKSVAIGECIVIANVAVVLLSSNDWILSLDLVERYIPVNDYSDCVRLRWIVRPLGVPLIPLESNEVECGRLWGKVLIPENQRMPWRCGSRIARTRDDSRERDNSKCSK